MENGVPAVLPAGPVTTVPAGAVALRPKQESFAVAYVAHGNASRAYREAFDCAGTMKPGNIRTAAYDLLIRPKWLPAFANSSPPQLPAPSWTHAPEWFACSPSLKPIRGKYHVLSHCRARSAGPTWQWQLPLIAGRFST